MIKAYAALDWNAWLGALRPKERLRFTEQFKLSDVDEALDWLRGGRARYRVVVSRS